MCRPSTLALGDWDREKSWVWNSADPMSEPKVGPKRSQLAQGRSRETRKSIIKAALELWSERGYDTGIDETTAEEIAARAGVAKATFYFHFARKEDILVETGWLTGKIFYEDALKALMGGGSVDSIIDDLMVTLCRRVEKVPRSALRRMWQAMMSRADMGIEGSVDPDSFGFRRAFSVIFVHAQQTREIPALTAPGNLGTMFEALVYFAIRDWAYHDDVDLLGALRERAAVLLAGVRSVTEQAIAGNNGRAPTPRPRAV